jgi:hypothetical protein
MPQPQQQTFAMVSQTMLQGIVETICDRPGDTVAQRDARSREVVGSVQSFAPRDPVELMLAGMVVMHAHLIHDSVRDLLRGRDDQLNARTKSAIVALDRGMIGFLRQLRIAQKRPLEANDGSEVRPEAAIASAATKVVTSMVVDAAKPKTPAVALQKAAPEPPVPLLPSLRPDAASVAAMMAILSPPVSPLAVTSNRPRAAMSISPKTPSGLTPEVGGAKPHHAMAVPGLPASAPAPHGAAGYTAPVFGPRESVVPANVAVR